MKWEYKVVAWNRMLAYTSSDSDGSRRIEKELDEFGDLGWELVAIYEGKVILKQPTRELEESEAAE